MLKRSDRKFCIYITYVHTKYTLFKTNPPKSRLGSEMRNTWTGFTSDQTKKKRLGNLKTKEEKPQNMTEKSIFLAEH